MSRRSPAPWFSGLNTCTVQGHTVGAERHRCAYRCVEVQLRPGKWRQPRGASERTDIRSHEPSGICPNHSSYAPFRRLPFRTFLAHPHPQLSERALASSSADRALAHWPSCPAAQTSGGFGFDALGHRLARAARQVMQYHSQWCLKAKVSPQPRHRFIGRPPIQITPQCSVYSWSPAADVVGVIPVATAATVSAAGSCVLACSYHPIHQQGVRP